MSPAAGIPWRVAALGAAFVPPTLDVALAPQALGAVVHVPGDHATVGAGIQAAAPGDTVLVAPGTYAASGLTLSKNLTLASHFLTTGDTALVAQTVLDGNGNTILTITGTHADSTSIVGLTFQDGEDGIQPFSRFAILHSRFVGCADGIDYESGSGGVCRFNTFENNTDDGVDCDDDVDIWIEDNIIRNNEDDGIEIRLQDYSGLPIVYRIRRNRIYGNGEDGIQLIDYPGLSSRFFIIERNLIRDNAMAGLGCMGNGNTDENYEAASIPETIFLGHNVIDGHNHGVSGGDAMIALHNIIINSSVLGMKNVDGASTVSYSCLWQNGANYQGSNVDVSTLVLADPELDANAMLLPGSPCIDAGNPSCLDPDGTICDIGMHPYSGPSGAPETQPSAALFANRPNPFSRRTEIPFELPGEAPVSLRIHDVRGRLVRTLLDGVLRGAGAHLESWDGSDDRGAEASSGMYFLRLTAGSGTSVRRIVLLRAGDR
jgi:hypothetical protein